MPSLIEKYGWERSAAAMASDDGKKWNNLSPKEKESYYMRVREEKKVGGNKEDGGTIRVNDMYKRMAR